MVAACCSVEGLALMCVQDLERQRLAQARLEVVRERYGPRVDRRNRFDVSDLFALEELIPERRAYRHFAMVAWRHRGARSG